MEADDERNAAPVRVDRWLCAARSFRSRTLAAEACSGGKVTVNGVRAQPHRLVRVGDLIEITTPRDRRELKVLATAERRGPAPLARLLYEDLAPVAPPLEAPVPSRPRGGGRPTKRDRRRVERLTRG